jgi:predicted dehydrogenase
MEELPLEIEAAQHCVVFGGAGQAGRIHAYNLQILGAKVASYDVVDNKDADANFNAKECDEAEPAKQGYKYAVVAVPADKMVFERTMRVLEAGYERVLIEKPGAMNPEELEILIKKAEEKKILF